MTNYVTRSGLDVAVELADLVEAEILPGLDLSSDQFWQGYADLLQDLAPENRRLLERRAELQGQSQCPQRPALGYERL